MPDQTDKPDQSNGKTCCIPGREPGSARSGAAQSGASQDAAAAGAVDAGRDAQSACRELADGARLIRLAGGDFLMGSNDPAAHPADGEGPIRLVHLSPFEIDATAVCNQRFARFVAATGYVTDAERFGWSFVFQGFLSDDAPPTRAVAAAPWWRQVEGAAWRTPLGPGSTVDTCPDHPVVHISFADAEAYCAWAGGRLPTEAEWEYAARGGLVQKRFPWGNELTPGGQHMCNVWQGTFPRHNLGEDGYLGTAPVDSFRPNGYGLFNMAGNAWEWCADWFHPSYHVRAPLDDPKGPPTGAARVMRGGSYLCHPSYCFRFRVAARSSAAPDSGTGHVGFRLARDA